MPVQINEFEMQVDDSAGGNAGAAGPQAAAALLPAAAEAWRARWLAARNAELLTRWAATDRDDER